MKIKTEHENNIFKTKDIGEAATLLTLGYNLSSLIKDIGFCWFLFTDTDDKCSSVVNDFWLDRLSINPRLFKENLRILKIYTVRTF